MRSRALIRNMKKTGYLYRYLKWFYALPEEGRNKVYDSLRNLI